MSTFYLHKEAYEEPACPLCKPGGKTGIPTRRVMEKLDGYLDRKDYAAAERHLSYWLAEAAGDARETLTLLNEQIGLYRKMGAEEKCRAAMENARALLDGEDVFGPLTVGTTLINIATGCKAFGRSDEALPLYDRAQTLYEAQLAPGDERLGALYNNKALALMDAGMTAQAEACFLKALAVMAQVTGGEADMAITYCNLADLASEKYGLEGGEKEIARCLEKAETLLNTDTLRRDGYYAFVCEKCAPTFGYYGFFAFERELTDRAEAYYERT